MSRTQLAEYLETTAEQFRCKMDPGVSKHVRVEIIQSEAYCGFRVIDLRTGQFLDVQNTEVDAEVCRRHFGALVQETTRLKKAWLMMVALVGKESFGCNESDLQLQDFAQCDGTLLSRMLSDLKEDVEGAGELSLLRWDPEASERPLSWLAERFDEWKSPTHCIGRVFEVEQAIGLLGHRRCMDCPPYAQVVLQGFHGAAIRHPEYHLASDMALLYNLFLDAGQLAGDRSEPAQSLGRTVVLTCFSLLEAFITGLATAFVYEHPYAPHDTLQRLKGFGVNGRHLDLRLDEKFSRFPAWIAGKSGWDINKPPFPVLFGRIKAQRNAMTHPSMPFQHADRTRIQNESRFHDITLGGVRETVELTTDAICQVWQFVHGKPRPSWLRMRQEDGRFPGVKLKLAVSEVTEPLPPSTNVVDQ